MTVIAEDGTKLPPPPAVAAEPRSNAWLWGVLLVFAAITAAALFLFDPARNGFFPACQFYKLTGLQCPGCGGLRATHQLLHGNITAAFRLNPLFVSLLPVILGWMAWSWTARRRGSQVHLPTAALYILLIAVIVFGIARNL